APDFARQEAASAVRSGARAAQDHLAAAASWQRAARAHGSGASVACQAAACPVRNFDDLHITASQEGEPEGSCAKSSQLPIHSLLQHDEYPLSMPSSVPAARADG